MTHLNKFKDLFTWFPKYMDLDETSGQVQGPAVDFTRIKNLQEASAASNRHEGLALLTTIAEDTGSCNPSPLLPNHLALEKRLISKILVLREALDLPCRSSCDALDQVHAKNSHLSHLKTMTAGLYKSVLPT